MKTILKTILVILALGLNGLNAQNLIIDHDITLGQNCGQGQQEVFEYQDVNFNGNYTLTLKGATLRINGNLNGTGTIRNFCSNNSSVYCLSGNLNGNITFDGVVDCNSLSTPIFNENKNTELDFKIYDLSGRFLYGAKTHSYMYETLPKGIYLVAVYGFTPFLKSIN